jgi:transposase
MRQIKEVLRLKYELGKSQREIKNQCGIGKTTVQEYLFRAKAAGISWPLPNGMTETQLEQRLFPENENIPQVKAPIPFQYIAEELRRPNVTLWLLWEEYMEENPGKGYQYSFFSELVGKYIGSTNYSMRQEHKAGEKVFVDFGDIEEPRILDTTTGEFLKVQFFVAVWGASQYAYAEATLSQNVSSWIKLNINALRYFGCVPKVIVPDNLKAAVTKACKYEPIINNTFEEFGSYYGLFVMPARPAKPKDKPRAENGVKLVKRWILARMRNRIFNNTAELNVAIRELLEYYNTRIMKKYGKSRKELFESLDKPVSSPLPDTDYEYAEWKKAKVGINYHISFEKHDYSIPYTLIHKEVDIKATAGVIEVYFNGERVCSHVRSRKVNGYTTVKEHMPPSHQRYIEWTPERIIEWAGKYGPAVKELVEKIIDSKMFPEQAYKRCLGIIRLANRYPHERLNTACERALKYKSFSYRTVDDILKNNADLLPDINEQTVTRPPIIHANIRGKQYFSDCLFQTNTQGVRK